MMSAVGRGRSEDVSRPYVQIAERGSARTGSGSFGISSAIWLGTRPTYPLRPATGLASGSAGRLRLLRARGTPAGEAHARGSRRPPAPGRELRLDRAGRPLARAD